MQRIPIHRDLAAADAEKAAEIDDRGAHLAAAVDEHVDDPAHVLVGGAAHVTAENALDFVLVEDGDFRSDLRGRRVGGRRGCAGGGRLGFFRIIFGKCRSVAAAISAKSAASASAGRDLPCMPPSSDTDLTPLSRAGPSGSMLVALWRPSLSGRYRRWKPGCRR